MPKVTPRVKSLVKFGLVAALVTVSFHVGRESGFTSAHAVSDAIFKSMNTCKGKGEFILPHVNPKQKYNI